MILIIPKAATKKVVYQEGVLKNIAIFTSKRLCWSLFLTKLQEHLFSRTSPNGCFYDSLTNINDSILAHILLFGKASLDMTANTLLLNATMNYIISTNRFKEILFKYFVVFCYMFISLTLFRILMYFLRFLYIHIRIFVLGFALILY